LARGVFGFEVLVVDSIGRTADGATSPAAEARTGASAFGVALRDRDVFREEEAFAGTAAAPLGDVAKAEFSAALFFVM
jgi:hypothetical protein